MSNQPQPTNDITALREILFATARALSDKTMDIDRAKAINETAQTIVNSAKVEVDAMRVNGGKGSGFIPALGAPLPEPQQPANDAAPERGVIKHRMK